MRGDVEFGVKITADSQVFVNGVKAATDELGKLTDSSKKAGDAAKDTGDKHESMAASIFKGVTATEILRRTWDGLLGIYHETVDATRAMQDSHTRLDAILRATGGTAGQTAASIDELAAVMSSKTSFDDTAIRNAAATLLTFKNISGDAFETVIRLSADLAASGRGDLQSWVTILAKAGTDPTTTLGALERVLGKLPPAMKVAAQSAAEMNEQMKAANLIYNEVKGRVDGTAEATYTGLARHIDGTTKAWTRLKEALGAQIFSATAKDAGFLEQAIDRLTEKVKGGIRNLLLDLVPFGEQLKLIASLIDKLYGRSPSGNPNLRQTGTIGKAPEVAKPTQPLVTVVQQNALREQDLRQQQAYLDRVYAIKDEEVKRELALDEYKHSVGLESDAAYFAKVEASHEREAEDEIEKLKRQIDIQKKIVGAAGAEVSRAQAGVVGGNDADRAALVAALSKQSAERQRLKDLTLQQADAELKLEDVEKRRGQLQFQADQQMMDSIQAIIRDQEDYRRGLDKQLDDLQLELDLIGKDEVAARQANVEHKLTVEYADKRLAIERQIKDLQEKPGDQTEKIASLTAELATIPGLLKNAVDKSKDIVAGIFDKTRMAAAYTDIVNGFVDTFKAGYDAIVNHTGNAVKAMRDTFKRDLFDWIYAQLAKPFLLRLITTVAGSVGASGVANAAGTALSNTGGVGSSILGGLSSSIFGTGALTGAGDFVGTGLAGLAGNMALAVGATDAFAATIAAAVPVIGWIVAIGAVLYSMFGSKGGGAKGGGSFMGSFDQYGRMVGNPSVPGTDNGRFFTPNQSDGDLLTMGRAVGTGFADTLRALGGHASGAQFGFGFDTDPNGTANNRVSATASVGGQTVYNVRDLDVGRDPQQLQDAIKLQTERAMLAALQASDLPEAIKAWLATVNASSASDQQIQDLLKGAQAIKTLIDESQSLSAAMAALSDPSGVAAVTNTLKGLDKQVTDTAAAMSTAANKNDPQAYLAAEQAYRQAVMARYQEEINMVNQLRAAIRQNEEQAYQFALNIAARINAMGGSEDIGGLAMGRANTLQGRIGGNEPVGLQIEDLQGYVGAIDTWYQSRHDAIMHDAEAQAAAQNALAQAAASAAQAQIAGLQQQLAAANALKAVVEQAAKMAKDMELSTANPLSALGRLQVSEQDVDAARKAFLGATGADRADAAQKLMDALQTEGGLAQGSLQRSSNEYQDVYNQMQRDFALISGLAPDVQKQTLDIEARIADLQDKANAYAAMTADATSIAAPQLEALNGEARGYYTWAQGEGTRLYDLQRQSFQDQLTAITGGQDIDLFIAEKNKETVALLQSIDASNKAFLDAMKNLTSALTNGGTPPPATNTTDPSGNPLARGPSVYVFNSPTKFMSELEKNAPEAARMLKRTGVLTP